MLCSIGIIAYFCGVQTGMAMRLHIFNIGIVRSVCFILVSENLRNFENIQEWHSRFLRRFPAWVCCLFMSMFGFSQDLQKRRIARSSTLSFYKLVKSLWSWKGVRTDYESTERLKSAADAFLYK